jgi:hypothetical protein
MKIKTIVYTLMKKIKTFVFPPMKVQKEEVKKSLKLYQDLMIPFSKYIDIVVSKDFKLLIIEGEASETELSNAWNTINELYIDAIGDLDTKIRIESAKEIAYLEGRINIANAIITQLQYGYSDALIQMLSSFGYIISIEPNEANLDTYIKQFNGYLNAELLELKEKLNEIEKSDIKPIEITRQYFEKIIVAIELTFKFQINIDKITTAKYCEYINSYNNHVKNLEKQINKNNGR